MMANIIWYAQKTIIGIEALIGEGTSSVIVRNAQWNCEDAGKPVFWSPEKQREKPNAHQSTVVQPMETKLCIMIDSTFRRPTSPP
jgi:hypothetical protein